MEEKKPLVRTKESSGTGGGNEEDDLVFPGFRFHPTDQELIGFYLKRRVENRGVSIDIIKEIDIYKHDPWDLPSEARHVVQGAGEKDWYFFCLRGRKYRNSIRPNRVTGSGFWKATGIDKPIHDGAGGECIGLKKSLVYYRGSAGRGTKTDWMMHEFRLPSTSSTAAGVQDAEIWTICRIFKRNMSCNRRYQQQKQEHRGNNKRSHHQQQLDYYYGYRYQNHQQQHYTGGGASMASSFESTTTDTSEAHATDHDQPFLLHGFLDASPADVTATTTMKTSATIGSSQLLSSSVSGWSELTSLARGGGSSWDELGRILEMSTDMPYCL